MITLSDSTQNNKIQDIFKKDYSVKASIDGNIEYNINNMIDKIVATSNGADHSLSNAFKNLFPIDSIYSINRPLLPGIKYYIYTSETYPGTNNQTDTPLNSFDNPRSIGQSTKPRLYYPGPDTAYKYWVGPKNSNINVSLEYFNNNTTPSAKLVPCNKVVARFETNHDTPTSWTISATKSDNTVVTLGTGTSLNNNGEAVVYYNGTSWSLTKPNSYSSTQSFKKITLTATNSGTGKFIGVLEFSPRWVVEIKEDIEGVDLYKETSISDDAILPVGTLSANLLTLRINKLSNTDNILEEYNRDLDFDTSKLYLDKNAIINLYMNVNDGASDIQIPQGRYYIVEWSLSEFGAATIKALDSTKILQDTLVPLLLIQDTPATSIIKRVLDSIGFSNYRVNVKTDISGNITDQSVPTVRYFWTKDGQTVWECLQELCRDMQINIFVDHNDVLQIYTRDFIYDSERSESWIFTNEVISSGGSISYIPNIISLSKKETVAGNSVKILWSSPGTSGYVSNSAAPVWISAEDSLAAGTLAVNLDNSETNFITLNNQTVDQLITSDLVIPDFEGYMLLNGEVIEYEGIEFQYKKLSDGSDTTAVIKSSADFWKHSGLAETDTNNINTFKPTGRYKIKKRGSLGTSPKSHSTAYQTTYSFNTIDLIAPGDPEFKGDLTSVYTSASIDWSKRSSNISKAFLPVTNFDKSKTRFTTNIFTFNNISTSSQPGYYSMGTRMFFDNQFDTGLKNSYSTEQIGGFTIFAGEGGKKGYHVILSTTALSKSSKDIRVLKTNSSGVTTVLKTSQTNAVSKFAGVYAAQTYNVDVLVKSTYTSGSISKNNITIWINGFRIDAEDTSSPLSPSNRLGLICGQGIVYYDYLYGLNIEGTSTISNIDYATLNSLASYRYNGVYSDDTISMLFGDLIYNAGETKESRNGSLIEFGSVARQIKKQKIRYDSSNPAIPIYLSTGSNKNVTIMASKLQPFTAEMYVLNNTSGFTNLSDGQYNTFQIIGNPVIDGGVVEYSTDDPDSRAKKYPVQFESTWIQSMTDAKALADWITSTQLNKGKSVDMEVFGNPLLAPGDIIKINYPLQDLSINDKKYIITQVRLSFLEGVSTSISCRAI